MPAEIVGHHWTREEVLALPDDGNRYELVDGALLVSPSPRRLHQRAVFELAKVLDRYVAGNRIGTTECSPADIDLRSGQVLQPDIFVSVLVAGRPGREWSEVGIPRLVVEVLSPSTALYDRVVKRALFQRAGVPVYWIVDLDARLVEVWTPDSDRPVIVSELLSWQPEARTAALEIELQRFFADVWDEPAH